MSTVSQEKDLSMNYKQEKKTLYSIWKYRRGMFSYKQCKMGKVHVLSNPITENLKNFYYTEFTLTSMT